MFSLPHRPSKINELRKNIKDVKPKKKNREKSFSCENILWK